MGIERYLCVNGVEVANPCRTLAYLRNLGNPCLVHPPTALSCCCCPDWLPGSCSLTVDAGFEAGSEQACVGVFAISGGSGDYYSTWDAIAVFPCPGSRPATPAPNDPAWTSITAPVGLPYTSCGPYDSDPYDVPACGWLRWRITDLQTATTVELLFYNDPSSASPGDTGENAVSFDSGATWQSRGTHSWDLDCPPETYRLFFETRTTATDYCSGVLAAAGGSGDQWQLTASFAASPAPVNVALLPPDGDPAWSVVAAGLLPSPLPPVGSCNPLGALPDGFWRVQLVDTGNGNTIEVVSATNSSLMAPGDFAGSSYSSDGGATWVPMTEGVHPIDLSFGGGASDYSTPALDDAPWYDPAVPESADVLGVYIEEARLSVPYERDARARQRGVSLSAGRLGGRELLLTGWVYTRSAAATAYARQWLFEALSGDGCDTACGLPDAQLWTHCDRDVRNGGRRTLRRVGLTSFDPELEPEFPRTCGLKFEATLVAEVPELLLDPELVLSTPLDDVAPVCNACRPCPTAETSCDCGALSERLREVPQADYTSAFCEPPAIMRTCHVIDPPHYWRDATAIITVTAGSWPGDPTRPGIANLHLRGWVNPAALDSFDDFDCQDPCLDVEVACVPASGQLVIDGTTRQATVVCELQQRNGYAYLTSGGGRRFQWPDVSCHGLMLCVEADALNTAPGSTIAVEFVLRERG